MLDHIIFSRKEKPRKPYVSEVFLVEHRGFEPLASTLPVWRAPSCANAPGLSWVSAL